MQAINQPVIGAGRSKSVELSGTCRTPSLPDSSPIPRRGHRAAMTGAACSGAIGMIYLDTVPVIFRFGP